MPTVGALPVDDVFGVLAHPVRRQPLERLAAGERQVTDLAGSLPVSRPAVSQQLRLMLSLGVVAERRAGRERFYGSSARASATSRAGSSSSTTSGPAGSAASART